MFLTETPPGNADAMVALAAVHDGVTGNMWQWLSSLPQGQATFLGTLTGSSIGLFAILLGALFNAHLNRRRDDRLRREDRKALIAALLAELGAFRDRLQSYVDYLKDEEKKKIEEIYLSRKMPRVRIFPDVVSKLGLLDAATIRKVIIAYNVAEGYEKTIQGVEDRVQVQDHDVLLGLTEFSVHILDTAIVALGGRPQDQEWWSPWPPK